MSRSRNKNLIHLVFATKYRRAIPVAIRHWLQAEIRAVMVVYLKIDPIAIGFDVNHVHVLFDLPADRSLEEVARRVKASSSKHARKKFPQLLDIHPAALWQRRYIYQSLGGMTQSATTDYINRQQAFAKENS